MGPIGWWVAAICGAFIGAIIFLIGAFGYSKITDAKLKKKIYGTNDRLNPRDTFFKSRRVSILDLALPFDPYIRKKTFEDCDLLGPCNIIVLGRTEISDCGGALIQAAIVETEKLILNAIALEDCIIRRCNLYQMTFLLPKGSYKQFSENMRGMEWITATPSHEGHP